MHSLLAEVLHLGLQYLPLAFEVCTFHHFLLLWTLRTIRLWTIRFWTIRFFYRFHWTIHLTAVEGLKIDLLLLDCDGLELGFTWPLLRALSFCLDRLEVHIHRVSRASAALRVIDVTASLHDLRIRRELLADSLR